MEHAKRLLGTYQPTKNPIDEYYQQFASCTFSPQSSLPSKPLSYPAGFGGSTPFRVCFPVSLSRSAFPPELRA